MATKLTAADLRVGNYMNWKGMLCTVIQINDDVVAMNKMTVSVIVLPLLLFVQTSV